MSEQYSDMPSRADARASGSASEREGKSRDFAAPLGEATHGRLEFAGGAANVVLRVAAEMPDLARAHFEGIVPDVEMRDGLVRISYPQFAPLSWIRYALSSGRHAADVTLNGSIPWRIVIRGGVARLSGDLSSLSLESFEIGSGASGIELTLSQPSGVVPIRVGGGASQVTLHRPRGAAARIRVGGGVARLAFDTQYFGAVGGHMLLETPGYSDMADRYDIEIGGGAAHLTVDLR